MGPDPPASLPLEHAPPSQTSNPSAIINPFNQSSNDQAAIVQDIYYLDSDDESLDNLDVTAPDDPDVRDLGPSTLGEDNEYIQSWDGYVFKKSRDPIQNIKTRSTSVTRTICSMVANICNRRVNPLQVENGLTMLACGVSERVNAYLQYMGLSVSRKTAIRALEHLGQELKKQLIEVMGEDNWLAPFITLDNIDFQEHVHTPTVQKESTMCNGSWGYVHRPKIPEGISTDHDFFTAEKLNAILDEAELKPINVTDVIPTPTEIKDWNLTLKSQIAQVLVKYVAKPIEGKKIPYRYPPTVTQLPAEKPDIMMLKMMSASDNSTAGVGELYNAVLHQTGLLREKYASRAQIWEGDLGTARIVSSVVDERDPCSAPDESFQHLIMILGAAHVMWNISQAILLEHWGSHLDLKDMGAWRGIEALAGRFDKPTSKKDFTAMIRSMERLHEGSITLCIQRVMKLNVETVVKDRVKMTPERMKVVIDETYNQYFGPEAIPNAKEQCDQKLLRFLLRLQDFATVIEASRAMSAGDVGRMIRMWKRWSVMANGMNRLKHYSNYLPRLIVLLDKTLPNEVADVIKYNLLVCPSGRAGHFVAKDFFLEVQNFWLKFFYNNVGAGTSIKRLRDLYSINVPLLREFLHQLKGRSGLNDVYQSHKNIIDHSTMRNFLRMAHQHDIAACTPGSTLRDGIPSDMYALGLAKLRQLAREKKLGRFHWQKAGGVHVSELASEDGDSSVEQDGDSSSHKSVSD